MDFFTKNKMLFWCVVVLVIANTVTLSTVWSRKPGPKISEGPDRPHDGQAIMEERLQLSEEQARLIEQSRNAHFERTRPIHDEMHRIRMDVLDEVFAAEPDDVEILEQLAELGNLQCQFEDYLFQHFQEMKDICDQQQAEELRFMLIDLIERTRPRDPKHHHRGRGREMGPEHGEDFRPDHIPPEHRPPHRRH